MEFSYADFNAVPPKPRPGVSNELMTHVDTNEATYCLPHRPDALPAEMIGWLVSLHVPSSQYGDIQAISAVVMLDKTYSAEEADRIGRAQLFEKIPISYFESELKYAGVIRSELYSFEHPGARQSFCLHCAQPRKDCSCPDQCWKPPPNSHTDEKWADEVHRWTQMTKLVTCEPICMNQVRIV
jgi:hypothetical protein